VEIELERQVKEALAKMVENGEVGLRVRENIR
jgi:hypothetical protein